MAKLNVKELLEKNPGVNRKIFEENQGKIAEVKKSVGKDSAASQVAPAYGGKRAIKDDRGFTSAADNWRSPLET